MCEGTGRIIFQVIGIDYNEPNSSFLTSIVKIFYWVGVAKDNQNINFFAPALIMVALNLPNDN